MKEEGACPRLLAGVLVPPTLPVLHHRGWVSARWMLEAPWTWLAFDK